MSGMNGTSMAGDEQKTDLRDLWNLLLRNRWIVSVSLLIGIIGSILFTVLSTPIYEAGTTVRIDENRSDLPVLDILGAYSSGSGVATEMEVLRSRTLAESVIDSLALQLVQLEPRRASRAEILTFVHTSRTAPEAVYEFNRTDDSRFRVVREPEGVELGVYGVGELIELDGARIILSPAAAEYGTLTFGTERFELSVETLQRSLSITRPNREADIVVVRHQSRDSILVHEVPNLLAHQFIAQRNHLKKTETTSTVDFLHEQIEGLADQLADAEDLLQVYREGEQVISLEAEASAQVRELAQLQAQRNQLNAERAALAELLEEVRAGDDDSASGYRRLIAFPSLLRNQAASELLRSLSVVENEHAELLKRRTARDPDVQVLATRIAELEDQLRGIALTYLQGMTNQVAALDETLVRFGNQLEAIPAKEIQLARLERQRSVLEEIYTLLQTRLKEAEIAQAVDDASVRVVDPAIRPVDPIKPMRLLNLVVGVILGLVLGVGGALIREFRDTTVHTREDIQALTGLSVLGLIPRIPGAASNGAPRRQRRKSAVGGRTSTASLKARLVTDNDPRNPISEAYRSLRTNITFARPSQPAKLVVFTSPTPGDGKSTTSANLAITLAQQGLDVLLVDADMRRGTLNSIFGVQRQPGLSNVLLGGTPSDVAITTVDLGHSGSLDFMSTGTLPPNPAELLGSSAMRELLVQLEDRYDLVILDAPPLNLVTDAALLGTNVDGVIVVARAGVTQKGAIEFAMEQLRHVRAPLLGAVLNDIDFERDSRYGKYGSYGYGHYQGYFMEDTED